MSAILFFNRGKHLYRLSNFLFFDHIIGSDIAVISQQINIQSQKL